MADTTDSTKEDRFVKAAENAYPSPDEIGFSWSAVIGSIPIVIIVTFDKFIAISAAAFTSDGSL